MIQRCYKSLNRQKAFEWRKRETRGPESIENLKPKTETGAPKSIAGERKQDTMKGEISLASPPNVGTGGSEIHHERLELIHLVRLVLVLL